MDIMDSTDQTTRKQLGAIQLELFKIHGAARALGHYHNHSVIGATNQYSDVIDSLNSHIIEDAEKALDILSEVI